MYIISPCKSYDAMFLPVGKSDALVARCVPLARCGLKIVIASRNTETHARYFCTCVEKKNGAYDAWNGHRIFNFFSQNNAAVIRTLLHYIKVEPY